MVGLISWLLFTVLYVVIKPFSFIYTVVIKWKDASGYWYKSGLGVDRYINYDCYGLLNLLFLNKNSMYHFGNFDDTMSYVLGINQYNRQLTWFGWFMVYLLWFLCPFKYWKYGHCYWAVYTK